MQCSSCQFENMPGITVCGRCGARLDLAAATVDVHPPRASVRSKRWRRWIPWQRFNFRAQEALARTAPLFRQPTFERSTAGMTLRMVVPGWPQMYAGHSLRGRLFLGLYLATLLPGLFLLGTQTSTLLLGLALATHISSIVDVVFSGCVARQERVVYTLVFCAAVGLLAYYPVVWLATRVVVPQRIVLDVAPFQAGDVFLYNPSAYGDEGPELGNVVVYDIPNARVTGVGAVYDIRGLRIDRVVAVAGQTLQWDGERLLLDGQPAPYAPLNLERLVSKFRLQVPDGYSLILPTTDPVVAEQAVTEEVWQQIGRVPHQNVRGKVFLRHQPLSRWWLVR
jgi:hypothetical protein